MWQVQPTPPQGGGNSRREITDYYIHSKAAIIDDKWATIGTANLDPVSLTHYGSGDMISASGRNVEVNAILFDGIEGPRTGSISKIRETLWREHLGSTPDVSNEPPGGWLQKWRAIADSNVLRLMRGVPTMDGRILPFKTYSLGILPLTVDADDVLPSLGIHRNDLRYIDIFL